MIPPLVVSDNSPLNLIIRLRLANILPALFSAVIIPPEVAAEMRHPKTPVEVQTFMSAPPQWLQIRPPASFLKIPNLDPGECAAISLAIELQAPLMIDEQLGRLEAKARGLQIIGAVGILERAAMAGLIPDLKAGHDQVRLLRFHVDGKILDASLARFNANQPAPPNPHP